MVDKDNSGDIKEIFKKNCSMGEPEEQTEMFKFRAV